MFGFEGKPGNYRVRSGVLHVSATGRVTVWSEEDAADLRKLGFTEFDPQSAEKAQQAAAKKAEADAAAQKAQEEFEARVAETVNTRVETILAAQQAQIDAAVVAAVAAALAVASGGKKVSKPGPADSTPDLKGGPPPPDPPPAS